MFLLFLQIIDISILTVHNAIIVSKTIQTLNFNRETIIIS